MGLVREWWLRENSSEEWLRERERQMGETIGTERKIETWGLILCKFNRLWIKKNLLFAFTHVQSWIRDVPWPYSNPFSLTWHQTHFLHASGMVRPHFHMPMLLSFYQLKLSNSSVDRRKSILTQAFVWYREKQKLKEQNP